MIVLQVPVFKCLCVRPLFWLNKNKTDTDISFHWRTDGHPLAQVFSVSFIYFILVTFQFSSPGRSLLSLSFAPIRLPLLKCWNVKSRQFLDDLIRSYRVPSHIKEKTGRKGGRWCNRYVIRGEERVDDESELDEMEIF